MTSNDKPFMSARPEGVPESEFVYKLHPGAYRTSKKAIYYGTKSDGTRHEVFHEFPHNYNKARLGLKMQTSPEWARTAALDPNAILDRYGQPCGKQWRDGVTWLITDWLRRPSHQRNMPTDADGYVLVSDLIQFLDGASRPDP